jgi:malate dehydrogenase
MQICHSGRVASTFPVTCNDGKYFIVQGLDIYGFSQSKMEATQKELEEERDAVAKIL